MEYSIHRLLSLKKTTAARITDAIHKGTFIATVKGKSKTVKGVPVENITAEILANYDKVNALISNYRKISAAILRSNAGVTAETEVRKVTVAGHSYTMAELICDSDFIYGNNAHKDAFKQNLLNTLRFAYAEAKDKVERQAIKVEADIQSYFEKAGTDKGMSSEDMKKRSDMMHEDGDLHFIDPLNITDIITRLEDEINTFRQECDATLSEQNAITKVEVNLTEIEI